MTRLLVALLSLLLFPQLGVIYVEGTNPCGTANLLYRLTFNDTAPFGTDEDAASTSTCTTRGADSTQATINCENTSAPSIPEGDAAATQTGGTGTLKSAKWNDAFSGHTTVWTLAYLYFDTGTGPTIQPQFIEWTKAGGAAISSGYKVGWLSDSTLAWRFTCGGALPTDSTGTYTDQAWDLYLFEAVLGTGTIYAWRDGGDGIGGSPDWTCDTTNDDSATPITGFSINMQGGIADLVGWDDIVVCDGDPR